MQRDCVAGTLDEMVCPGGELAFVSQMVKDSMQLQARVHWYTSMVGKKATVKALRRMLHDSKGTALRTTEFVQVSWTSCTFRTKWFVQGSFCTLRYSNTIPFVPASSGIMCSSVSQALTQLPATAILAVCQMYTFVFDPWTSPKIALMCRAW